MALGVGTWVCKFGWPAQLGGLEFAASFVIGEKTWLQMNLITAHAAVGSLILAFGTVHAFRCYRALGASPIVDVASPFAKPFRNQTDLNHDQ